MESLPTGLPEQVEEMVTAIAEMKADFVLGPQDSDAVAALEARGRELVARASQAVALLAARRHGGCDDEVAGEIAMWRVAVTVLGDTVARLKASAA